LPTQQTYPRTPSMLLRLALLVIGLTSVLGIALAITGHQHQERADKFWGEHYSPATMPKIEWGPLGNWFIPEGGPLLAAHLIPACSATSLPLLPVKLRPDGSGQALCGIASDASVIEFHVDDMPTQEIRDYLRGSIQD